MTLTILNGDSKTIQDQYTGPENELSVDESDRDLRLHDAATPGGKVFLNRDNADFRYQARNTELDGLVAFEPQQRGFLVRRGPADYVLRKFEVDAANMAVTRETGYEGNPVFGIADTITSEHTWTGQQSYLDVVEFQAGINADVSGNLTGNVLGNLTGNVTGNLTGNANGNHSGSFAGDVDVRGQTLLLDDGQIPQSKIAGLMALLSLHGVPYRGIIMWSGPVVDIPEGWALCDGTNGTPDCRGMFIIGAGGDYAPHATGGTATHVHTITVASAGAHTHGITVDGHTLTESEMPSHFHGSGVTDKSGGGSAFAHGTIALGSATPDSLNQDAASGVIEAQTSSTGGGTAHSHTAGSDSQGAHDHTATADAGGSLPPYYALCLIMRTAY